MGLMRDNLREETKMPVIRERLINERIMEDILLTIFLRTVVGIGS